LLESPSCRPRGRSAACRSPCLGAAIGLLLAPQSGTETLELVRGRVEAILEEGRQAAERSRADAHARLADLKEG